MSARNKKLQLTMDALHEAQSGTISAEQALIRLVWAMLEPAERKLLAFIVQRGSVTSADVVAQFKVSQNYASTDLKRLSDLGLLKREPCAIGNELGYRYMSAEWIVDV